MSDQHQGASSGQKSSWGASTTSVHAGVSPDPIHGAIMTPIYQTSTYVQPAPGAPLSYDYSRGGNPTREALEGSLAGIENAKHAISFGSGLAAVQAVIQLARPGDHVLVCDDVYGGTGRLFRRLYADYGIEFEFADLAVSAQEMKALIRPNTRFVWIESPTNPLLKVIDIQHAAEAAHSVGAQLIVDNTFASPIFQSPLSLGADIVMHSLTKYIGGHSDIIGGALMLNNDQLEEQIEVYSVRSRCCKCPSRLLLTLTISQDARHSNGSSSTKCFCGRRGPEGDVRVYFSDVPRTKRSSPT